MPTLDWLGKSAVVNHHHDVPFHLLKCDDQLSVGDPGSGNLLVQADNLLALKALLPYYAGQVKCIYIDPPYNTGNENWVYNDNVNSPEIRAWLGKVVGSEGEDLSRHDKWLCMMYPRLQLLSQMLRDDGVIFINIDDDEVAHLRLMADEIFGEKNFIANIVWQKKQSPQNDAINFSDMHDHILVYARKAKQSRNDLAGWQRNLVPRSLGQEKRYTNPDDDPRGAWASTDATVNKTADERPNLYYAVINPLSSDEVWPSRRRTWLFEKPVFERLIKEGRIWWGTTGNNFPRVKKYWLDATEGIVPATWWGRELAGDNQESRRELRSIFQDMEGDAFATPKPTRLIKRILQIATNAGDIIMDSFAGSGTTGHAVLQMNKQDGANRRFILVEMEPGIAHNITAERLKRVINGIGDIEGLGGGFRYCTLGPSLFDADGQIRAEVTFAELAQHVFFIETGEPLPTARQAEPGSRRQTDESPLLGVANGLAVYLLYNGVLGDKSPQGGNVLTRAVLAEMPPHAGPRVIYGTGCRLAPERLKREGITFRQIPYEVKVR